MSTRVDAAIVGGGPAGSVAARLLALRGWRVLLIERGRIHRPKACGHCVGARAVMLLRRIGVFDRVGASALGTTRSLNVHGQRIHNRARPLCSELAEPGLLVDRANLDQTLRDFAADAGAILRHATTARIVHIREGGSVLRTASGCDAEDVECRLVIGADGVGSGIARAAGLAGEASAGRKYGFAFDWPPTRTMSKDVAIERGGVHMFLCEAGYLGIVRGDDGAAHVAALVDAQRASERDPLGFVHSLADEHAPIRALNMHNAAHVDLQGLVAAGPIPWRPRGVASASVALVGDAAGYVEPFTGEGVTWAIDSAMALARVIGDHHDQWDADVARVYAAAWSAAIARRQRLCRMVTATLERPRWSRWMLRLGHASPRLTRRLVREVTAP